MPLLAGIFLIICGSILLIKHLSFFKNAIMVDGVCTSVDRDLRRPSGRGRTFAKDIVVYAPVVTFTFDGEERKTVGKFSKKMPKLGTKYRVGINPVLIEEARVFYPLETWLLIGMIVLGVVMCALYLSGINFIRL